MNCTQFSRIAARAEAGDHVSGLVPECFIAGTAWGPDCDLAALAMLVELLLPALAAGLVASSSDIVGRAFYKLAAGPISDERLVALVDARLEESWREEHAGAWADQLTATRRQILSADPGGEIGPLPMHVGILRSPRRYDDLRGIEPLFSESAAAVGDAAPSTRAAVGAGQH